MGKPEKQKPKISKKAQYERFLETARDLRCDESQEEFERKFAKIVPPKVTSKRD